MAPQLPGWFVPSQKSRAKLPLMPTESENPKPKRGRPPMPKGATLPLRTVRLSDDHWAKAQALGEHGEASDGLRKAIDAAWARRNFQLKQKGAPGDGTS